MIQPPVSLPIPAPQATHLSCIFFACLTHPFLSNQQATVVPTTKTQDFLAELMKQENLPPAQPTLADLLRKA